MKDGNERTPGPWQVDPATGDIVAGPYNVCITYACKPADKAMMAAAPDLLAFAVMILEESDYQHQRDAARVVIAKATPESEIAVLEQGRVG